MVRMRSIFKKTHHDTSQKILSFWKINFWPAIMICVGLFLTYPASSSAIDETGNSAFFDAVKHGRNARFLANLISRRMDWKTRNKNNDTALHVAALHGNLQAVNLLLSKGSDVNAQNSDLRTPLHQAVLSLNVSQNTFGIVRKLVISGAKTNLPDVNGDSVLELAQGMTNSTTNGQVKIEIIEFLSDAFNQRLTHIIDELEQLKLNSTKVSRMFQIVQTEDLETIIGVLDHVGKSRDVTEIRDEKLHSLLHVAIKYRDYSVVEYFLNSQGFTKKLESSKFDAGLVALCLRNTNTVLPSIFDQKVRILQLLFNIQPDWIESNVGWLLIDERNNREVGSPLLYSAGMKFSNGKQLELIQMLIDNNANVNATTLENSNTALHLVFHYNSLEPSFTQIIRTLIENDADTNAVDNRGNTFLQYVAGTNPAMLHETVELLDSVNNTNSFSIKNWNRETVLHKAVKHMEVQNETLQIFHRRGVDFNSIERDEKSVFYTAFSSGRSYLLLKNLIAFGAEWELKDKKNNTALHIAALSGNMDVVKFFMQLGADVNALNEDGETPLHTALSQSAVTKLDLVSELVNHGANLNIQDESGNFPIELAQRNLNSGRKLPNGIIALLEYMNNQTSFHQNGDLDGGFNSSVKLTNIFDELDQLELNSSEITRIIIKVVRTEDLNTIKGVLDHVGESINVTEIWDEKLHSLLHVAVKYRDYSVVEYLINSQGFSKKLNDTIFNSELVEWCMDNIVNEMSPTFEYKFKTLQLLFSIQPDLVESIIKVYDGYWARAERRPHLYSPLLYSTEMKFSNGKQLDVVEMLIENKANVNSTNSNEKRTALHLAAKNEPLNPEHMQIIRILIENHADTSAVDNLGNTFLHYLTREFNSAAFHDIVEYMDSINNTNAFHIKNLKEETVLHDAVDRMEVQKETLEIFHRNGVDWRLIDDKQNSALHVAASHGNLEAVKFFIQLGADVNALNSDGNTPLHNMFNDYSKVPRLDVVSELVNRGANVNIKNKSRKLAVELAGDKMRWSTGIEYEIIQLLESTRNLIFQDYD